MSTRRALYKVGDYRREITEQDEPSSYRSQWRRDYGRVIHSPSFRRLQGKTQLFYGNQIVVRNRLTHSLEVAQIAKTIALKLRHESGLPIEPDITEIAGLVHDLGHPPFGHNGEAALDDCMPEHGGFEGNAQTLRILARLEKRRRKPGSDRFGFSEAGVDCRCGMNLTARVLASALKYDNEIPSGPKPDGKRAKGYYSSEAPLVKAIKANVLGPTQAKQWDPARPFKTVECQIMDIADDIAYSTYDLEDALKAGLINPLELLAGGRDAWERYERVAKKIEEDEFECSAEDVAKAFWSILGDQFEPVGGSLIEEISEREPGDPFGWADSVDHAAVLSEDAADLASNGYRRMQFTSTLVGTFVDGVQIEVDEQFPSQSKVFLKPDIRLRVEVLKRYAFVSIIESPRLKIPEYRGYDVVKAIFLALSKDGGDLLPDDFRSLYKMLAGDKPQQCRLVCDFVAGMTDHYATAFFNRLNSETPDTIFGPWL